MTEIVKVFSNDGVTFALAGGFAFSIHIIPRATTDIDFVIFTDNSLKQIELSLEKVFHDIIRHSKPIKAGEFDVWRFVGINSEETTIDILIPVDPEFSRNAADRITYIDYKDSSIPVLSIEDIYIMKKKSARLQDMHDCKMIEEVRGESLDWKYIREHTDRTR